MFHVSHDTESVPDPTEERHSRYNNGHSIAKTVLNEQKNVLLKAQEEYLRLHLTRPSYTVVKKLS